MWYWLIKQFVHQVSLVVCWFEVKTSDESLVAIDFILPNEKVNPPRFSSSFLGNLWKIVLSFLYKENYNQTLYSCKACLLNSFYYQSQSCFINKRTWPRGWWPRPYDRGGLVTSCGEEVVFSSWDAQTWYSIDLESTHLRLRPCMHLDLG